MSLKEMGDINCDENLTSYCDDLHFGPIWKSSENLRFPNGAARRKGEATRGDYMCIS